MLGGTNLPVLGDLGRGSQTPWPYDAYPPNANESIGGNIARVPRHDQMSSITSNGSTIQEEREELSNERKRK
jgi:hypothetical protein